MAKQKSKTGKISNGGRQEANLRKEAKRQAKFSAKREAGKAYEYKANPYKKGSRDWKREKRAREEKRIASMRKLPLARLTSIFAKLDNRMAIEKEVKKNAATA